MPQAAAKGQALSATWILRYQQEEGGDVLMGELFRQSDPACFMHAAVGESVGGRGGGGGGGGAWGVVDGWMDGWIDCLN